jgi:predicted phosphodiesterase
MSMRIVHLSDLHYPSIDLPLWGTVKSACIALQPDLIVVSGDLVDQPFPDQLAWARRELDELEKKANAQVYVVPGNHDLFEYGSAVGQERRVWFDQTFRGGTQVQIVSAATAPVARPAHRSTFWRVVISLFGGGQAPPPPAVPPPAPPLRSLVRQPPNLHVLLALFDSNPTHDVSFAGGAVPHDDLLAVSDELTRLDAPHLIRIAVIHHHVLPIAHSGGRLVGREALMVLENAGTLLGVLARHRFDLVLHGHKHRQQFARIDLSPGDESGYPIAVASAGAAALLTANEPRNCSFNLITVEDNGQISVRAFYYGEDTTPAPMGIEGIDYRTYDEPTDVVPRRALLRTRDRHGFICSKRTAEFTVTENGDLITVSRISGLRPLHLPPNVFSRPHSVRIPVQARLAIVPTLDAEFTANGCRVEVDPAAAELDPDSTETQVQRYWVRIPGDLTRDGGADYETCHAVANSMVTTQWEAEQRKRVPQEWVGVIVDYPAESLQIDLMLPPGCEYVQPTIVCQRLAGYPDYEIDPISRNATIPEKPVFEPDHRINDHLRSHLRYMADERRWRFTAEPPMVGYSYLLRWDIPHDQPDRAIHSKARAWQKTLLGLGERFHGRTLSVQEARALDAIQALADTLKSLLAGNEQDEQCIVTLFAYDDQSVRLTPALSWNSWSDDPVDQGFRMRLGQGIAGAAFLQRRTVAWAKGSNASPLIKPVAYPDKRGGIAGIPEAILAIPIFHDAVQDEVRPPPWAAIGTVSFSSSSPHSAVYTIDPVADPANADALTGLVRKVAQGWFNGMLQTVYGANIAGRR